MRKFTETEKKVLSIFRNTAHYSSIHFSQMWVAKTCQVTRQTINQIIKKFSQLGLIEKTYRHMKTNIYKVSKFIKAPTPEIKKILLNICFFWVGELMSRPMQPPYKQGLAENPTQTIYSNMTYTYNNFYLEDMYISSNSINGRQTGKKFNKEDFVQPIVKKLKGLTWEQKFKLSVFPINALRHAESHGGPEPRYEWFKYLCEDYCKKKNLRADWRTYYKLCDIFKIKPEVVAVKVSKKTQKEEKMKIDLGSNRPKYTTKMVIGNEETGRTHPVVVFMKSYEQMQNYPFNFVISKQKYWQLGVVNMVTPSFITFCGGDLINNSAPNLHPDNVLFSLDRLAWSERFCDLILKFGLDPAKEFLIICIDAILNEQRNFLNSRKPKTVRLTPVEVLGHQNNINNFLKSENYVYLSSLIGELQMKNYMDELILNWTNLVHW